LIEEFRAPKIEIIENNPAILGFMRKSLVSKLSGETVLEAANSCCGRLSHETKASEPLICRQLEGRAPNFWRKRAVITVRAVFMEIIGYRAAN
jgi:hypothetical protein